MSQRKNAPVTNAPYFHRDHARPMTRRELMGQGFLGMSATLMAPTLLTMIAGRAEAQPMIMSLIDDVLTGKDMTSPQVTKNVVKGACTSVLAAGPAMLL